MTRPLIVLLQLMPAFIKISKAERQLSIHHVSRLDIEDLLVDRDDENYKLHVNESDLIKGSSFVPQSHQKHPCWDAWMKCDGMCDQETTCAQCEGCLNELPKDCIIRRVLWQRFTYKAGCAFTKFLPRYNFQSDACWKAKESLQFQMDSTALGDDGECIQKMYKSTSDACQQNCINALEGMQACIDDGSLATEPVWFSRLQYVNNFVENTGFEVWETVLSSYDENFLKALGSQEYPNPMHAECVKEGIKLLPMKAQGGFAEAPPEFHRKPRSNVKRKRGGRKLDFGKSGTGSETQ